jgi:carbonic anhydrase
MVFPCIINKIFNSNSTYHLRYQPTYQFLLPIFLALLLLAFKVKTTSGEDWCYEGNCGPKTWGGTCTSGIKQSPINILTSKAKVRLQATRLVINKNYVIPKNFILTNTGHTVQLTLKGDESSKCYMIGDGLGKNPFYFSNLHFHWGPNDRVGSEHRLSGRSYPLEMHMVHKLKKDTNKIAVLGVLFYISPRDNPNLNPIIRNLGKIVNPGDSAKIPANVKINLTNLLPKRMRMFRYIGSLTTPPCSENVIWTVFQDPIPVSKRQLANFRKLIGSDMKPMKRTFRPVQPAVTTARKNIYFLRVFKRSKSCIL